jgi:hypothetical protein
MRIALIIAPAGVAHHHRNGRIVAEVDIEFRLHKPAKAHAHQLLQHAPESGAVAQTRHGVAAAIGDLGRIGQHAIAKLQRNRLLDKRIVVRVAIERRRGDGLLVEVLERGFCACHIGFPFCYASRMAAARVGRGARSPRLPPPPAIPADRRGLSGSTPEARGRRAPDGREWRENPPDP